ncbi:MAG: endo-1,4-beta-xylanase [Candidatus Azobacteroides sp.]|nr:endo-1,4-beta-xylanase [Candidatus Azobacteroides sp.]
MKLKNIIPFVFVTLIFGLNGCYDEKMEWGDPYTHPAAAELPLQLQEAISRYDALKTYTDFKLGVGIDFNLYTNNEEYRNLVNENFDEIVAGNEMKQSSLMNSSGVLNFDNVDKTFDQLKSANLTVYGHVLVWHTQQQASYLNSLIAPTIIPGTPDESLVDGSFENGMAGWAAAYYKENYSIVSNDAVDGTQSLQVIIPSDATGGKYDGHGQLNSPDFSIIKGHHYQISFWIKGSAPGEVTIDFPNGNLGNQYPYVNGAEFAPVGTTWTQVIYNTETVGGDSPVMIATTDDNAMHVRLLLASVPNVTYLIDAIEITDLDAAPVMSEASLKSRGVLRSGPTTIEKTPEEKAAILEPVLVKYITDVVTHFSTSAKYKGMVPAWEVVNEPMNDNGSGLKTGVGATLDGDDFYWQDYLGKDYAVIAFKAARAADPDAKLFINDYNLESTNSAKLDGLIDYVRYIESQGATVDGIATQLHLNINWSDTTGIKTMFQKLAATGKLIKVSELDVAISSDSNGSSSPANPVSPTLDQFASQAELYRYVADIYTKIIPANQRYSITVWSVSDNENEHEYWLKNDAPCLWNADYARKHAYKGFADGLAGKDVSSEFSGELKY